MGVQHSSLKKTSLSLPKISATLSFQNRWRKSTSEDDKEKLIIKQTASITSVFTLGPVLGRGQFGVTKVATHKKDGKKYACKSISKEKLKSPEDVESMRREVSIMHMLSGHEHIVQIVDLYEEKDYVHIVMELCTGGELLASIMEKGILTEHDAAGILRSMLRVVAHCHDHFVIHRDLKPENFLISHKGPGAKLKAIDFGISRFCKENEFQTEIAGSMYYIAPEVLKRKYSFPADIWSCGVILYILLCGEPPFQGNTNMETFRAILDFEINFTFHPWPCVSDAAKNCITQMLTRDPEKRPTARQMLQHEFLREHGAALRDPLGNAVLNKMMKFAKCNKLKRLAFTLIVGQLPKEETEGLRRIFNQIDEDGNGSITVEELKHAMERKGVEAEDCQFIDLVKSLDIDSNGEIDYDEFVAANIQLRKLDDDKNIRFAFDKLDTDNSEYLTRDEIVNALHHFELSDSEIDDIVLTVDANRDGKIDFYEFRAMIRGNC